MRTELDRARVLALLEVLGRRARGPGRVYLTGGTSAVLVGWRTATVDADLKLDPEPLGVFEAIRDAKEELDLNVELASPDDFLPPLPGWRDRSPFIARHGLVDFYHYDFYAQALSKIDRGHGRDLSDVQAMMARGLVHPDELRRLHGSIEGDLLRYPAVDPGALRRRLDTFLRDSLRGPDDG